MCHNWFVKTTLKDFFIPHAGNDYAPHSLQKAALIGMSVLVLLSFSVVNVQSLLWMGSQWLVSSILPAVIVDLTNEERADSALSPLRRNAVLDRAAQLKAQDMAEHEYFAHYSPQGVTPWHWFGQVQYNFVHAGENLAIHFTDSSDVVEAWMESPSHRANILSGNFAEIGVGTAEGTYEGFKTVYVVQMFGTPAAPVVAGESTQQEEAVAPEATATQTDERVVLAEAVELTEQVEIVPPPPVLVTSTAPTGTDSSTDVTSSTSAPTSTDDDDSIIEDIVVSDHGVALYSDLISTSTGGVPATLGPVSGINSDLPWYLAVLTQPHLILQTLYVLVALFVLGSLALSIFIEIRRQQPIQIAYSMALLLLMVGLFYAHVYISGGAVVV